MVNTCFWFSMVRIRNPGKSNGIQFTVFLRFFYTGNLFEELTYSTLFLPFFFAGCTKDGGEPNLLYSLSVSRDERFQPFDVEPFHQRRIPHPRCVAQPSALRSDMRPTRNEQQHLCSAYPLGGYAPRLGYTRQLSFVLHLTRPAIHALFGSSVLLTCFCHKPFYHAFGRLCPTCPARQGFDREGAERGLHR